MRRRLLAAFVLGLAAMVRPAGADIGAEMRPQVTLILEPAAGTAVLVYEGTALRPTQTPPDGAAWYGQLDSGTTYRCELYRNGQRVLPDYDLAVPYVSDADPGDGKIYRWQETITVPEPPAGTGSPINVVTVKDHDGNPLSGVAISYLDGYWRGLGSTNGSGQVTSDKLKANTRVRAERGGTVAEQTIVATGLVFYTTEMTAIAQRDSDDLLNGVAVSYLAGYYRGIGSTKGDGAEAGRISVELFPTAAVTWRAEYGGSAQTKTVSIPGNSAVGGTQASVAFQSSLVTVTVYKSDGTTPLQGVAVSYLAGYYRGIGSTNASGVVTCELFDDGTRTFRAEYGGTSATQPVTVTSGASATFYTSALELWAHKSNGDNLPGVAMSYCAGYYRGVGSTASAVVAQLFPTANVPVRAEYGGTSAQQTVTIPGNGVSSGAGVSLDFYTTSVTVEAKDSTPKAIDGVAMSYLAGYYRGLGSTTGGGPAVANLFGGTYDFRAEYGGTVGVKEDEAINGAATGAVAGVTDTVSFQLTKCTLLYNASGRSVSYVAGYERGISNPAEFWLFDGTYKFRFGHSGAPKAEVELAIAGPLYKASIAIIKLLNSAGAIVPADDARYDYGGWKSATKHAASNLAVAVMPYTTGTVNFAVSKAGASITKYQSLSSANGSIVVFQTKKTTFKLLSSKGAELVGEAWYDASGWKRFGDVSTNTTTTMELLPVTYNFMVKYAGASQSKYQNLAVDADVTFQTVAAVFTLLSSDGTTELVGEAWYDASGWKRFGVGVHTNTTTTMELLPVNYNFMVKYAGASQSKYQNLASSADVTFQTVAVTMSAPAGSTGAKYDASGWKTFGGGTPPASMELLPVTYNFGVTTPSGWRTKYQSVGGDANVVFP